MKALIVEDEPLAVENLRFYLKDYPLEIIGSVGNIREAGKFIREKKPDVVFLDINLSGENGFQLLDLVDRTFKIIFVTAYDEFAVRAFEVNALDYILKPLKKERIAKAIARLSEPAAAEAKPGRLRMDDSILLTTGMRARLVKLKDICLLEADSSYSKIILRDGSILSSTKTLKKWVALLPEGEFVRVHRGHVVNVGEIGEVKRNGEGRYKIKMSTSGGEIEISRRHVSRLKKKLNL